MQNRRHRFALVALSTLLLSSVGPTAGAHPITVDRDRTDNDLSFAYEAESGDLTSMTSSRRTSRNGDDVEFEIMVRETDDAGSGLQGRLRLRLNGDHRTIYDGWFSFRVTTPEGKVAFQRLRPANLHLRPRPGQRRATLVFRFDLPSGDYEAAGYFRKG